MKCIRCSQDNVIPIVTIFYNYWGFNTMFWVRWRWEYWERWEEGEAAGRVWEGSAPFLKSGFFFSSICGIARYKRFPYGIFHIYFPLPNVVYHPKYVQKLIVHLYLKYQKTVNFYSFFRTSSTLTSDVDEAVFVVMV